MKHRRRVLVLLFVAAVAALAWYASIPQVPAGQAPLVTVNAATMAELRTAFNRDADQVRVILLLSPT